jgi:hypothetical protein
MVKVTKFLVSYYTYATLLVIYVFWIVAYSVGVFLGLCVILFVCD